MIKGSCVPTAILSGLRIHSIVTAGEVPSPTIGNVCGDCRFGSEPRVVRICREYVVGAVKVIPIGSLGIRNRTADVARKVGEIGLEFETDCSYPQYLRSRSSAPHSDTGCTTCPRAL